jgi:precorrin-3B synthase
MNAAATIEVKGWCPGALQPMQSGDGLLVRVRPWCGAFERDAVRALADVAERHGNGHIDLTRRANLQIRGVREADVPEMQRVLREQGLLDRDPAIEAGRNIMVSPLSGLDPAETDVRPIARELVELLASDGALRELPAKFGFLVDGGGAVSIADQRANISARAVGDRIVLGVNGRWLGTVAFEDAAPSMVAAARSFLNVGHFPALGPLAESASTTAQRPLGKLANGIVGVAAPFGRLEAWQLRELADVAEGDIRLSPWRAVYFTGRAPEGDLILDDRDPRLGIDACPGAPACASSTVDTRGLASRLAANGVEGSVHVSGCAKGCARSEKADLVLVGQEGRYGVVRNGTSRGWVERTVDANEALNV